MSAGRFVERARRRRRTPATAIELRSPSELGLADADPLIREMRPSKLGGWRRLRALAAGGLLTATTRAWSAWSRRGMLALSTLEHAEYPDGSGEVGLQWHVSFSRHDGARRCSDIEVQQALVSFQLRGAEEDNHHPGVARHFWMPVDPARRVACECKASEVLVEEPDGYRWSNSADDEDCRGCELAELTGRPCPIHAAEAATR